MPRLQKNPSERTLRYRARRAAFYQENRIRLLQESQDYRKQNRLVLREKAKSYSHSRFFHIRAKNLGLRHDGLTASTVEVARLWRQQKGICPFTGVRLNRHNAQLDHIIPVIRGGSGTIENLRWILRDANYAKRDLTDEQFLALCRMVVSQRKERT